PLVRPEVREEERLERVARDARPRGAVEVVERARRVEQGAREGGRDQIWPIAARDLRRDGRRERSRAVRSRSRQGHQTWRDARHRRDHEGAAPRRDSVSRRQWRGDRGEAGLPDAHRAVRTRAERADAAVPRRVQRKAGTDGRQLYRHGVQRAEADRNRVRVRAGDEEENRAAGIAVRIPAQPSMPVSTANSRIVYDALKASGVRVMSALPETWLVHLIRMAEDDPDMTLVRLAKEEEGVGISAGAHLAGVPSAMLMQNHGFLDRKSTRLNSSHQIISYAVF